MTDIVIGFATSIFQSYHSRLSFLREPVTTYPLWSSFVQASSLYKSGSLSDSVSAVQDAVTRLPPANRDTLAFMLLHLIRVAETPATKMPVHNLAKVRSPYEKSRFITVRHSTSPFFISPHRSGFRPNHRWILVTRARGAADDERTSDASGRPRVADERNRTRFLGGNCQGR